MTYASTVLADSPLGYWRFDEASGLTLADSSGNSRNMSYTAGSLTLGVTTLLDNDLDTALALSGTSFAPPSVATATWLNLTAITLEAWIDTSTTSAYQNILDRDDGSSNRQFQFRVSNANKIELIAFLSGGIITATSTGTYADGLRHHVIGVISGATATIYVDGVQDGTATGSGTLNGASTLPLAVGYNQFSTGTQRFQGTIDEPAVYGSALSSARILAHYNAGTTPYAKLVRSLGPIAYWRLGEASGTKANDLTGHGHDGTYVGTPTLAQTGLLSSDTDTAVLFGTGKYVSTAASTAYDIAHPAVIAWFKSSGMNDRYPIVSQYNALSDGHWQFRYRSSGRISASFWDASSVEHEVVASPLLDNSTRHMAVMRYNGTTFDIFVDGTNQGTLTISTAMRLTAGVPLFINALADGTLNDGNTVDEVAYFDASVLTDTVIANLWAAGSASNQAIAGTSHGVGGASGSLSRTLSLAGTSHGVGHASGALTVPRLELTATGTRHRGGSVSLAITTSITPPAGTPGQGWEWNGRTRGGLVALDLEPADAPYPANLSVVPFKTLTNTYPAPTIVDGRPYADAELTPWAPTDGEGTHGEWGYFRVIIGGYDRTFVRGVQTLITDYSDEDPGGPTTLTLVIPAATSWDVLNSGDLLGIKEGNGIIVERRFPDHTPGPDVWVGELGVETDTLVDAGSGGPATYLTFSCRGWWLVLDDFITQPRPNPDPIEAAAFIHNNAFRARIYGWPAYIPRADITGLLIPERGEYGAPTGSQTVTNALKLMQRRDGTVYTIKKTGRYRLEITERIWGGTPDFTFPVGQRGLSHTLTRDPTVAFTAIFGRGQHDNQAWENWQYPTAYVNPPIYPLPPGPTCGVNLFCAGSGATGFQAFSDELRAHGWDLASQDTYLAGDFNTIEDYQDQVGIQVDGVVGPQTWNQAFQLGQNADVLADPYIRELWSLNAVRPYLLNARGGVTGKNPDFAPNTWRRREKLVDYGVLDKATAALSARLDGAQNKLPYYVGTVVARNIDPLEMHAMDTFSGMNMRLDGHRGVNRMLHVVKRDVVTGMTTGGQADRVVTWTVSEKPDDMMTLAQILARKQGVRDLVKNNRPQRRSAFRTPDWVPFDSESGAGIQTREAQFAGLWNVYWVPMGEAVDVNAVKLVADRPTQIAAAMFNTRITPAHLQTLPGLSNPSAGTTDPWAANTNALNALGIQWATGGPNAMQGYWPNDPGGTLTGVLADTAPWPFRTLHPPYGYLAVWTSVSCEIGGDPAFGFRAIFPAPEH